VFLFFFLKATKLSSQPAQYIKKSTKTIFKKKESILGKINEKKTCKKKETKAEKKTRGESYSVLKKKTKKLNFQPV
jgi:hypothetical protein